jgi:hypothetical protein
MGTFAGKQDILYADNKLHRNTFASLNGCKRSNELVLLFIFATHPYIIYMYHMYQGILANKYYLFYLRYANI